jgi:hypothetical protein
MGMSFWNHRASWPPAARLLRRGVGAGGVGCVPFLLIAFSSTVGSWDAGMGNVGVGLGIICPLLLTTGRVMFSANAPNISDGMALGCESFALIAAWAIVGAVKLGM